MSDFNDINDPSNLEGPKLPSGINVLTILTFIGCTMGLLKSCWDFIKAEEGYKKLEDLQASGDLEKMPAFLKKMVGPEALEMARKALENKVPIFIISIVAIALCFYGALQMRKLKKQGFFIYLVGEVLPLLGVVIFIGVGAFSGFGLFFLIIPALFIALYYMQLKYMK